MFAWRHISNVLCFKWVLRIALVKRLRREFHEFLGLFLAPGDHLPGFHAGDFGLEVLSGFGAAAQDVLDRSGGDAFALEDEGEFQEFLEIEEFLLGSAFPDDPDKGLFFLPLFAVRQFFDGLFKIPFHFIFLRDPFLVEFFVLGVGQFFGDFMRDFAGMGQNVALV